MKHVINFSGGICSFWAADRVIKKYGRENVTLLFADTLMEDEDLYRFLSEAEAYFGIVATRIAHGRTPWELFADQGLIGHSRAAICSVVLKRAALDAWRNANCIEWDTIVYLGLDWTEGHRLEATREALPGWNVEAPMCEAPYWDKCKMQAELRAIGIEPPRLYRMGFPHNNCGGFCVKAGQAHFAHLLKMMPARYAFHEAKEEAMRAQVGDYSVMKDRRGGGPRRTLTMRQLRERIEAGENFDRHDWGGCGCSLVEQATPITRVPDSRDVVTPDQDN